MDTNQRVAMSTLKEIEAAIETLPPADFWKLRDWMAEYEADAWDRQIESDVKAGKLDKLADEALAEFDAGRCRSLP